MKIVVGIQNGDDLPQLRKAGADEYYVGIVPQSWSRRFGYVASPNRRETKSPNISAWDDLERLVQNAHHGACDVFLAANAHEYSSEQMGAMRSLLSQAMEIGIDGFIVGDPALLVQLPKWGINTRITLSGDFGFSNSTSLDWVAELRLVDRIIFGRHTSLASMHAIIERHPHFQYEAFVLNERCFFAGSHCMACHGICSSNFCSDIIDRPWTLVSSDDLSYEEFQNAARNIDEFRRRERIALAVERNDGRDGIPPVACGLCSVPRLKELGVSYLKVVSRGLAADIKERLVRLVARVRDEMPLPGSIRELYVDTFINCYPEMCDDGYNCYRID